MEPGGRPAKEVVNEKVINGVLPFIPDHVKTTTDPEVIAIREAMLKCYTYNPKESSVPGQWYSIFFKFRVSGSQSSICQQLHKQFRHLTFLSHLGRACSHALLLTHVAMKDSSCAQLTHSTSTRGKLYNLKSLIL